MNITIKNLTKLRISTSCGTLEPLGAIVLDPEPTIVWKIQDEFASLMAKGYVTVVVSTDASESPELEDTTLRVIYDLIPAKVSSLVFFGDTGNIPSGIHYMYPGVATVSNNEILFHVPRVVTIKSLSVSCRTAPGVGHTDTFVVRKNQVDTICTVSLAGLQVQADSLTSSVVTFQVHDNMSVKTNVSAASALTDVTLTVEYM